MHDYGIGDAVGGVFGLIGQAINYSANKKLQEQQNQFNLDMWNKQNEYNSPKAQMQRFQEAGLNPNLIYGQGTSGNAQSAPVQQVQKFPDISREMAELGQAFNIVGLKKDVADMHVKEEKATQEAIKTQNQLNELNAKAILGSTSATHSWQYNPETGRWIYVANPSEDDAVTVTRRLPLRLRWKRDVIGRDAKNWEIQKLKEGMYRLNMPIRIRAALAAPEIKYRGFEATDWRHKTSWWLQQVGKGTQAINQLVGAFY